MITYIFDTLRNNPELAIFLTLSLGYALGKLRYRMLGLYLIFCARRTRFFDLQV